MKYDEDLKKAYDMIKNLHYNEFFDDLKQEIAVELWLHPDEKIDDLVLRCRKKVFGEEKKHQIGRAESIYNDEGECLDDDFYFVDDRTVEHNDFSYISDEIKEKVSAMVKTRDLISRIYAQRKASDAHKIYDLQRCDSFISKTLNPIPPRNDGFSCALRNLKKYNDIRLKEIIYYENKRNQRIALQSD